MYRCYISRINNNKQQKMSEINLRSPSKLKNHEIRNCWSETCLVKEEANTHLESSTDGTKLCPINVTDVQQCMLPDSDTESISRNELSFRMEAEVDRLYLSSRESFHSASPEEQPPVHVSAIDSEFEDSKSTSEEDEPAIFLHEERSQYDKTEINAQKILELQDDEFSEQRILPESRFLHSQTFTVEFGNDAKDGVSLQKAFSIFKKQRQNEIKKERKCRRIPSEVRLRNMSNSDRMWKLRMKFLNQAKTYFGTPYSKKYWTCEDSEYYSPLFLDCCGLVRKILQDLREQFQFRIGPWNQAYMFDTLPITVTSHEQMKPGDLVFISAIYHNTKAKKQKHNMVHVEIWLGEGVKTIGARWQKGKVQVFDSYKFNATSYHSPIYILKSIDTWLTGVCQSYCPEHPWKRRSQFKPSNKSVFAASITDKLDHPQTLHTNEQLEYRQNKDEDQEQDEEPGQQQEQTEYNQGDNLQHEQDELHNNKTLEKDDKQCLLVQSNEPDYEQNMQSNEQLFKEKEENGQLLEENKFGEQLLNKMQLRESLLDENSVSGQQLDENLPSGQRSEVNQLRGQLIEEIQNVQVDSMPSVHSPIETDVACGNTLKTLQLSEGLLESQHYFTSSNKDAQQQNVCDDDKEINNIQLDL